MAANVTGGLFGRLGRFGSQPFALPQSPGHAAGQQYVQGQLGSAPPASFGDVLGEVGGTPASFTDIPQSAFLSPQQLTEMTNALFAQGAGRTAAQQEAIREGAAPGTTGRFGMAEQLAAPQRFNDALAQREATRLAGEYAPTINRQAAMAQTGVEAQRAADERNRRALAMAKLQQETQRENALLASLNQFGQQQFADSGFGGGGLRVNTNWPDRTRGLFTPRPGTFSPGRFFG